MLVGSLFGKKILLLSDLAKWYLEHGLIITRVYQLVEYIPRRAYADFGDSVSNARRAGDSDPDKALLASTSKLIGNSAYGKTITNKEKHKNVKYVNGAESASAKVRGRNFDSLTELVDDYYEVVLNKSKVSVDLFDLTIFHKSARHLYVTLSIKAFCCRRNSLDKVVIGTFSSFLQIRMNVPVVLGFAILQHAKLRMLEFYYDFMDR